MIDIWSELTTTQDIDVVPARGAVCLELNMVLHVWSATHGTLHYLAQLIYGTDHVKVGGLLSFGVSKFQGGPIFNWQLLFLILGCATCVWSFFIGLFLPDSPYSAKCYTEEEKALMIERVRDNETGISNKEYKKYQVVEALTDPFVWCCVLMILVANFIIGGLGVFSNLIIEQFGFTLLQTQLLNIAQGAWTIGVMVGSAWTAQRIQKTCLVMLVRSRLACTFPIMPPLSLKSD